MGKNVLQGNMACYFDWGDPNRRYQQFLENGLPPFRSFFESLLLFDQIVIPTNDFMPLALLAGVLGEQAVAQILESAAVKFARFAGGVAYVGNGGGILEFKILSKINVRPKPFCASSEEALQALLDGMPSVVGKRELKHLAMRATVEFRLPEGADFQKLVYDEVARTPSILSGTGLIDLNRLPGVDPNGVRGLRVCRRIIASEPRLLA